MSYLYIFAPIFFILLVGIRIIRPTYKGLIERLGKYYKLANPVFHWIISGIDRLFYVNITELMADALRLQKMNISPDLIELRKIEANLKAIEKWNGVLPQVTGAGAVPFIGVNDLKKN